MAFTVEATYEGGVLKPIRPLPLQEHEKVQLTVHSTTSAPIQQPVDDAAESVRRSYGLLGWTGDLETLRRLAEDPEFDPQESGVIFADLPPGATIFLDANTLVYHFAPDPILGPACTDLLVRIKRQEIDGCTSTHVLSEVGHRLMTIEAMKLQGWPVAGIAQRLRQNPAVVRQLAAFRQALQEVPGFGIRVVTILPGFVDQAAAISQQTGLLSNDALIVAVMNHFGWTNLASHDADFDGLPGLARYAPV